jgi:hypothetical protein
MKQTAVKWLIEELVNQKLVKVDKLSTYYWYKNYATTFELLCENAIRMEKEQIIEAWIVSDNPLQRIEAEKYYNETYKEY